MVALVNCFGFVRGDKQFDWLSYYYYFQQAFCLIKFVWVRNHNQA
jgi:hypothetical protein